MRIIKSIFVIEDDKISSFVIKLALEQHPSFKGISEFINGQVAIDFLVENSDVAHLPELILLDINMPVMDGWDFLEKFSVMPQSCNIPVVMLTSSINPDDMEKAQSHELVKGFLSKPLNEEKLDKMLTLITK